MTVGPSWPAEAATAADFKGGSGGAEPPEEKNYRTGGVWGSGSPPQEKNYRTGGSGGAEPPQEKTTGVERPYDRSHTLSEPYVSDVVTCINTRFIWSSVRHLEIILA